MSVSVILLSYLEVGASFVCWEFLDGNVSHIGFMLGKKSSSQERFNKRANMLL